VGQGDGARDTTHDRSGGRSGGGETGARVQAGDERIVCGTGDGEHDQVQAKECPAVDARVNPKWPPPSTGK